MTVIKKLYVFIHEEYKKFVLYAIFLFIAFSLEMAFPVLTGEFMNNLVSKKSNSLNFVLLSIAIVGLANQLISPIVKYLGLIFSELINQKKRFQFIKILRNISYKDLSKISAGSITQRFNLDLTQVSSFLLNNLFTTIFKFFQTVIIIIYIYVSDVSLGFLTVAALLIYSIVYYIFKSKVYLMGDRVKESNSNFYGDFYSQVANLDYIVHQGYYEVENERFVKGFNNYFSILKRFMNITNLQSFLQGVIALILNVIMFRVAALHIFNGTMDIGKVTILMSYFSLVLGNTEYFFDFGNSYQLTKASIENISLLLGIEQSLDGTDTLEEEIHEIYGNLTYAYDEILYEDLFIHFERGKSYSIVGQNGSGKSTLYKLLSGIIHCSKNMIYYNGKSLSLIDSVNLRQKKYFFVTQRPYLMDLSIKNYFKEYFDISEKDFLENILSKNMLLNHDISSFLDSKWDIPQDNLSGGDLQTAAIIASFISGKDVLVYDEPTSNLDSIRKDWFLNSIKFLKKRSIVMIISHDDEVIKSCDQIIQIKEVNKNA